jgi:hypothetical protein
MRTPHDRFFHYVFSKPEHAVGELQAVLGSDLSRRVDWATLAPWRSGFLGYIVEIWERHRAEHPEFDRIPAVFSLVVYHGEKPWPERRALHDLVDLDTELLRLAAPHVPNLEFFLDDISTAKDHELRSRAMMSALGQLALLCLGRTKTSQDFLGDLARWADLAVNILESPLGTRALSAVWSYILESRDVEPDLLLHFARELGPKAEEAYMTGAQILSARARAEGKAEGKAEVILNLLVAKFGDVSEPMRGRVIHAKLDELDRWAERLLTAKDVDEVFAD